MQEQRLIGRQVEFMPRTPTHKSKKPVIGTIIGSDFKRVSDSDRVELWLTIKPEKRRKVCRQRMSKCSFLNAERMAKDLL